MSMSKVSRSQLSVQEVLRQLAAAQAERDAAQVARDAAQAARKVAENKVFDLENEVQAQALLVRQLHIQLKALSRKLAEATDRSEQQVFKWELDRVQKRLDELNRERFGTKSERCSRGGDNDDGPTECGPPTDCDSHGAETTVSDDPSPGGSSGQKATDSGPKQPGHGPTPQPNLKREEQLHLLPPDTACIQCGGELKAWKGRTQDCEEVDVVERTYRIKVHKHQTYRCRCCRHLETAPADLRLVPGGRYSLPFAVSVAVDKYRDAIPLARQVKRMGAVQLKVTSQTLWDQINALATLLHHNYLALQSKLLEQEVLHADETPWRLIKKGGSKRWWVWALTDGKRAFFLLAASRGQAPARQLLGDFAGVLVADRYVVYEALEKGLTKAGGVQLKLEIDGVEHVEPQPNFTHATCWMHARRGFFRAHKAGEVDARVVLDLIGRLYSVEAEAKKSVATVRDAAEREAALLEARRTLRTTRSRGIVDVLDKWVDDHEPIPGTLMADAITWIRNGRKPLRRFLDDPRLPLDNGEGERRIRPLVLGRKVFHGARSEAGTRVAAVLYSLVESCALQNVDAREYLRVAAERALDNRKQVFLPEDYARELACSAE